MAILRNSLPAASCLARGRIAESLAVSKQETSQKTAPPVAARDKTKHKAWLAKYYLSKSSSHLHLERILPLRIRSDGSHALSLLSRASTRAIHIPPLASFQRAPMGWTMMTRVSMFISSPCLPAAGDPASSFGMGDSSPAASALISQHSMRHSPACP